MPCKDGEIKCPIADAPNGAAPLGEFRQSDQPVREVFLFHGFDKRSARQFRIWQKRQARAYNRRHGTDITLSALDDTYWDVVSDGVRSRIHFMDWSDIVRSRLGTPFWVGATSMAALGPHALMQNVFFRLWRMDRAMALLTLLALGPMLIALVIGIVIAALASGYVVLWLVLMFILFWLLHRFDHVLGVFYAAHIAWVARRLALRDHPSLEERLSRFSDALREAQAKDVIIAGHSIGSALAVRLFEFAPERATLLTLGQSIPLVTVQKEATLERQAMQAIRHEDRCWIDMSAGHDTLGFSAFDPSGGGAQCYSAHFRRAFGDARIKSLRWRATDMHFLYFAAPERRAGLAWDWFDWLSGADPLEARFKNETPRSGRGARNSQN